MRTFFTLWRKEVGGYLLSPIAYVTSIFFLVVMGFSFWLLAAVLAEGSGGITVLQALFESLFFWIALLVVVPVITMRCFADEKRTGTLELLMTAPVRDTEVVLAKFAGALTLYILMWLPTVAYAYVLRSFSPLTAYVDFGPLIGGYTGALLIGAFYISIGIFSSSLTSNQIIAAITCFALFGLFFFSGLLEYVVHQELLKDMIRTFSPFTHMSEFSRGMIDTRPVVLYLTATAFMLFVTVRVLESRKWKK